MLIRSLLAALALAAVPAGAADISMEISPPRPAPAADAPERAFAAEPAARAGAVPGFALDAAPGVELQRRGGAQGDLTMRASTFQQALLLVDGAPVNDPQTAHHNLDLPLTSFDVERAEVLPGAYSPVYGPDAYAGAVNVRTRRPAGNACGAGLTLGDFSARAGLASCTRASGGYAQRVSVEKARSGGFRKGTDYDSSTVFTRAALRLPSGTLDAELGWLDKNFGASRFYSTVLSGERERTGTFLAVLSHTPEPGPFTLRPQVRYRHHYDRFSYVYNAARRANTHVTGTAGASLRADARLGGGASAYAGAEYAAEDLDSTSMGGHSAGRAAVLGGGEFSPAAPLKLGAALRADRHSRWGWQVSPALRADCQLSPEAGLWAAAGRSFREPSFTELYYDDPGNKGDPSLKPERAVTYEAGAGWKPGALEAKVAVFRRHEKDTLDWTRPGGSGRWTAANIGRADVTGGELSASASAGALRCGANYAYAYKDLPPRNYVSKYALRYARHKAGLLLDWAPQGAARLRLDVSAVKRAGEAGYVLAGASAGRKFGDLSAEAGVENALNAGYEEIPGAGAPGRSFRVSLSYSFN